MINSKIFSKIDLEVRQLGVTAIYLKFLTEARDSYFNQDDPIISDSKYDELFWEYKSLKKSIQV